MSIQSLLNQQIILITKTHLTTPMIRVIRRCYSTGVKIHLAHPQKNCRFERDGSASLHTRCRSEVHAAANKRFDWQTDSTCQASLTFSTAKFPPADSECSFSLMAAKLSSWLTYRLNYTLNDNAAALTKYRCTLRLYQA